MRPKQLKHKIETETEAETEAEAVEEELKRVNCKGGKVARKMGVRRGENCVTTI